MAVTDLDEAETFYRDVLGARRLARFDPPGLLFFDFGGVRVMFERAAERQANSILYLWTDDMDGRIAELEARGVEFTGGPHAIYQDTDGTFGAAGETEWMAFFEDPAGNVLVLVTRKE